MVFLVVHLDIMQVVVQVNIMHQLHLKKHQEEKVVEEMVVDQVKMEQPTLVEEEQEEEHLDQLVAVEDQV